MKSKQVTFLWILIVITSMILSACTAGSTPEPQALKIVTSLPLSGGSESSPGIVNAVNLRLEQVGGVACGGKYKLVYESLDDAKDGKWNGEVEAANAQKAADDPQVVVYIGPLNSGAAMYSIPILNQVGLPMISMANTYPGLTKPGKGEPDEPTKYYPTGVRNYLRVIAADDVQGAVAANFIKQLGAATVYVIDSGDLYGKGVADVFAKTAVQIGLNVVGHESFDPSAADYTDLMNRIATSNAGGPPDAIYAGMTVDENAAKILQAKVAVMGDNTKVKFMGPDGIVNQAFIDDAGTDIADGVYGSEPNVALADLPPMGQQFITDYTSKYGELTSGSTVVAGYEAINVALKAIENVCASGGDPTNRKAVRDALFAIQNFQGVLGSWSFDENGDISLTKMTLYQVQNGKFVQYSK